MKITRLADVCEILIGRTPSRSEPSYWGGDLPWLSIADMNQGRHLTRTKERVTAAAAQACKLRFIEPGTVVMSFKLSIGKVGITATSMATNEAIAALPVKNREQLDPGYLSRLLESMDHAGGANRAAMGGTLNKSSLASIPIPLPPLADQRRIAAILDKADELRIKRREALAHLDTLTQSIFHSMFGDPVSNPQEWPLHPLSELGNLDRGVSKHRPRNDPKLLGGPYPLVQTGDVARAGAYLTTFAATYSELGLRQSRLWPAGTLCITIAANIAKTAILKIQACFPDSVVGFTANPATTQYVRVWLSFLQATLEAQAPESAQKNINLAILNALQVPVPPLELQQAFATRITAVERLKETHRKHLAELDALFASLQHRAFMGEL